MRFSDSFLDDVRARLKPSDVVVRYKPLRRAGAAGEWVAKDDDSFTVSDRKGLIHDFGSTGFSGDIFKFVQAQEGCTFVRAVEVCAGLAGLGLPKDEHKGRGAGVGGNKTTPARPNGAGDGDRRGGNGSDQHPEFGAGAGARDAGPTAGVSASWDYTDADGSIIYQEAKIEWVEDGKRKKIVLPRREIPGVEGWVWGLKGGEYVRGQRGEWWPATEGRAEWRGARQVLDECAPLLYQFADLLAEMRQPLDERRTVLIPEGAKDADTITGWGMVATTSSGGTGGWMPHFAEFFRGADVVIPIDNDSAGRKFGHQKAHSLRGVARRIRILDFRDHWAACPEKGDITDWRDLGGGDRDKLFALLDRLPDWQPEPPESAFNALRWADLDKPARELEWLVKKVLTRGEVSIWWGPPGCGKSFLITDLGLAVARGVSWFGQWARSGLVVYQAGESGLGLKRRLRAYRRRHVINNVDLPFVLLSSRVDLFAGDADTTKLIEEIRAWGRFHDAPLELVVVDTFAAASPGANENASEDVGRVLQRCHRIADETGAHVALVHHTSKAGGSPRGWSGFTGNVENSVEVVKTESIDYETRADGSRVSRPLREFIVRKQKDEEDGFKRSFVLKKIVLGQDAQGEEITSCTVEPVGAAAASEIIPPGYAVMRPNNLILIRALAQAIAAKGMRPPPEANAPEWTRATTVQEWRRALVALRWPPGENDPDGTKLTGACKRAIERTYAEYRWNDVNGPNLIGKTGEVVWRTDRRVHGVDPPPSQFQERPPEPEGGDGDLLS